MSRGSPFIAGLLLGSLALGAGFLAFRYLPTTDDGPAQNRDRLLAELPEAVDRLPRALPRQARTQPCGFGQALVSAQRQSVKPVNPQDTDVGPWDHQTPESRIDAMLDATACQRPGVPLGLDEADIDDLLRSGPMLVRRAHAKGERLPARAWALRIWALAQDLVAVDPEKYAVLGFRLQAVSIDAFVWWWSQADLTADERAEGQLLARALMERAPAGQRVVQRLATISLRRGLEDPAALTLEPNDLSADVRDAAAWWKTLADATATPAAAPPERLSTEGESAALFDKLTHPHAPELVQAHHHLSRARLAAVLLFAGPPPGADACPAPWEGEPPVDPVTAKPAEWDANLCRLTLGDRSFGPGVTGR